MARTIRPAAITTRTSRARLKRGRQPHLTPLTARAALGYVRRPGEPSGRWILRRRIGRKYSTMTVGIADDSIESDGVGTLTFFEAKERALELAGGERVAGSITVGRAFEDYRKDLKARGKSVEVANTTSCYLAEIADVPVAEITTSMLQSWLASVAAVSVRNGQPADDDAARRRRNSANRIAGTLIAALNLAYRAGRASSDKAWRHLRRFEGVDAARTRYLTVAESVRLLNACPEDFRRLVHGALLTGARFGELARLVVSDFSPDSGTLAIRRSKTGRGRHVILTDEGSEFFTAITAGRGGDERMLARADGEPWRHSNQARPMRAAVERAKIAPRISFHALRHSYASLSIMGGVPLLVLAKNLGHVDSRMVEKHYGHLSEGYVAAAIRAGAPVFGGEPGGNIEPFKIKRDR
jgi:integrase